MRLIPKIPSGRSSLTLVQYPDPLAGLNRSRRVARVLHPVRVSRVAVRAKRERETFTARMGAKGMSGV
jgi:hypothetical protein